MDAREHHNKSHTHLYLLNKENPFEIGFVLGISTCCGGARANHDKNQLHLHFFFPDGWLLVL